MRSTTTVVLFNQCHRYTVCRVVTVLAAGQHAISDQHHPRPCHQAAQQQLDGGCASQVRRH